MMNDEQSLLATKVNNGIAPLPLASLYQRCDPQQFAFATTEELFDLTEIVGQERAIEAVQFGIGIRRDGYNLFALGPAGMGKHTLIRRFLEQQATTEPTPSDWCYVNNFDEPQQPRYLQLPAGQGIVLRQEVVQLVEELRSAIQAVFESEGYRTRRQAILDELKEQQETSLETFRQQAEAQGIALLQTPTGFALAPMKGDDVIPPDEFNQLPESERARITKIISVLHEQLQKLMLQVPNWERASREKLKQLHTEVTTFAVEHLIDELRRKYQSLPEVTRYFDDLQKDVIENADAILNPPEAGLAAIFGAQQQSFLLRRYQINLLIDHNTSHGAPMIYEDHPTFQNLIGQIEYVSQFGALVTDFNLIRPGALHRANGGYLMLDAHKVLMQPYAWEGLKRLLRSGEIRIESLGESLGLISTVSLKPQPIPLSVKVVLLGERILYYLLCHYDPEFSDLFKVAVDFEEEMTRSTESHQLYAQMIGTLARKEKLLPFERTAVARVIEHSARLAGDSEKLSTHATALVDLLREADYWATQAKQTTITANDVQRAIEAQIHRADRVRQKLQEEVLRGTLLIDTAGEKVGQINGLSVLTLDKFAFGHPTRITARVRLGKGEVIDIEREVELGGPIHSKGVLILAGFLGARYAPEHPLSLSASLVFEQSYGGVEGDSASSAELYALLSALADAPIKQSLAVTGSVNQQGQVQAIGGVNEKIEGFFDVCRARGLTGTQGVLIPASNVKHLMLRQDVIAAVAANQFHIYAVETIDQGIELLTGIPAGERDLNGQFPTGSLNQRVEARLIALADKRAAFGQAVKAENEK